MELYLSSLLSAPSSPFTLAGQNQPHQPGLCLSHSCIRPFMHLDSWMEVFCLKLIHPSRYSSSKPPSGNLSWISPPDALTASPSPLTLSHSICDALLWSLGSVLSSLLTPCISDHAVLNYASLKLVQMQDHSKDSQLIWNGWVSEWVWAAPLYLFRDTVDDVPLCLSSLPYPTPLQPSPPSAFEQES